MYTPEECMVLHTDLPQPLSRPVIGRFEPHSALKGLEFSGSNLDVKIASLVRYLQDLQPGEPVDVEPVDVRTFCEISFKLERVRECGWWGCLRQWLVYVHTKFHAQRTCVRKDMRT